MMLRVSVCLSTKVMRLSLKTMRVVRADLGHFCDRVLDPVSLSIGSRNF